MSISEGIPQSNQETLYYNHKGIILCDDIIEMVGDIWLKERYKPCEKAKQHFGQCVMSELLWLITELDPGDNHGFPWWSKENYHDCFGDYGYKWIYREFKDDRNICRQADGKVMYGTTWKGWVLKYSKKLPTWVDPNQRRCDGVYYTKNFCKYWWQDCSEPGRTNNIETASPFDWCEFGIEYNTKNNERKSFDISYEEQLKQSHW